MALHSLVAMLGGSWNFPHAAEIALADIKKSVTHAYYDLNCIDKVSGHNGHFIKSNGGSRAFTDCAHKNGSCQLAKLL